MPKGGVERCVVAWLCPASFARSHLWRQTVNFLALLRRVANFLYGWHLLMLTLYCLVQIPWVYTNSYLVQFHYHQHTGRPHTRFSHRHNERSTSSSSLALILGRNATGTRPCGCIAWKFSQSSECLYSSRRSTCGNVVRGNMSQSWRLIKPILMLLSRERMGWYSLSIMLKFRTFFSLPCQTGMLALPAILWHSPVYDTMDDG